MKATVFHEHGGPEVLSYEDIPTPEVNARDVLVEVKAVALNHLDLFVRSGIPGLHLEMPHILGSDIAGIVSRIGDKVPEDIRVGDRVIVDPGLSCGTCEFCKMGEESLCPSYGILGEHHRGGYAENLSVDYANIIKIPNESRLDFAHAAAIPLTLMTAWRMLMSKAKIRKGEDVLIIGIGGGVAVAALQIAKAVGARVLVTSSSDQKLEKARDLGADITLNHDATPDYHKAIRKETGGRGVDVVVDSVGAATWDRSLKSLRKGGRLVTCGATSGPKAETNVNLVFWNQLEILGSTMASRSELREALKLVWDGRVKPIIDRTYPLSEAREAHELLERGGQFGKIVLQP